MPSWSVKTNEACWNCDHFQRMDPKTEDLDKVFGQCRRRPQGGNKEAEIATIQMSDYWPFIEDGRYHWCSKWQITTLTPPTAPAEPDQLDWPEDWTLWEAFNVKAVQNIMCWNCDHFQRNYETPTTSWGQDTGSCFKEPPVDVEFFGITAEQDNLKPSKLVYRGGLYWCGCWEVASHTVPALPDVVPPI